MAISRVDMKHKVAHFVLSSDQNGFFSLFFLFSFFFSHSSFFFFPGFKLKGPSFPTVGALVSAYREKYSLYTSCPGYYYLFILLSNHCN